MMVHGGFFSMVPPNFSTNKKTTKQPITAFLSKKIYWNSICHWLIGNFPFGTEIGGYQWKKSPCIFKDNNLSALNLLPPLDTLPSINWFRPHEPFDGDGDRSDEDNGDDDGRFPNVNCCCWLHELIHERKTFQMEVLILFQLNYQYKKLHRIFGDVGSTSQHCGCDLSYEDSCIELLC